MTPDRHERRVMLALTERQYSGLTHLADIRGLSKSAYCRMLVEQKIREIQRRRAQRAEATG